MYCLTLHELRIINAAEVFFHVNNLLLKCYRCFQFWTTDLDEWKWIWWRFCCDSPGQRHAEDGEAGGGHGPQTSHGGVSAPSVSWERWRRPSVPSGSVSICLAPRVCRSLAPPTLPTSALTPPTAANSSSAAASSQSARAVAPPTHRSGEDGAGGTDAFLYSPLRPVRPSPPELQTSRVDDSEANSYLTRSRVRPADESD